MKWDVRAWVAALQTFLSTEQKDLVLSLNQALPSGMASESWHNSTPFFFPPEVRLGQV